MPISLRNLVGSGAPVEIGECIMMQDQSEPILELDDMVFLKSGHVLVDEETEYPEAYEKFGRREGAGGDPTIGLQTLTQEGQSTQYMRIK